MSYCNPQKTPGPDPITKTEAEGAVIAPHALHPPNGLPLPLPPPEHIHQSQIRSAKVYRNFQRFAQSPVTEQVTWTKAEPAGNEASSCKCAKQRDDAVDVIRQEKQ